MQPPDSSRNLLGRVDLTDQRVKSGDIREVRFIHLLKCPANVDFRRSLSVVS